MKKDKHTEALDALKCIYGICIENSAMNPGILRETLYSIANIIENVPGLDDFFSSKEAHAE